jgi:protein-disulfide isomerase
LKAEKFSGRNLMLKKLIVSFFLVALAAAQTKPAPVPQLSTRPAPASAQTTLPTEETVNSFMQQMFGYDPTLSWKVAEIRPSPMPGLSEVLVVITGPQGSNANRLLVSADGKHAISGDVIPFGAKPFDDARVKLEKGVNGPAKGPAKAPVTIVEFSDMQCPHCKEAAPSIDQLVAEEPGARFIFQNFPIPGHNWAEKAAGYVDCIGRSSNDAVWKFIQKTFEDQTNITESNVDEKLKAIATESGANADETAACAEKSDTKARVQASAALGKSVGVTGTPTLFINGRMLGGGIPVDAMKKIVEFQGANSGQ